MHGILVYIPIFSLLGGTGMYFANRKVDEATSQKRWLKFTTYIAIVSIVMWSILQNRFYVLSVIVSIVGLWEVIHILIKLPNHLWKTLSLSIYFIIAITFIYFSFTGAKVFLLFICFQTFIFDAFCQIVGQIYGKRKLLPDISPNKTWEGLIGGIGFCLVSSTLGRNWIGLTMPESLFIGVITISLAFTGDMMASYLKRLCDVKDYSDLLPSHGGFLDRFDSLLLVGAGYCLLFQLGELS
jgi:phosphatidate cytidylyltransferase